MAGNAEQTKQRLLDAAASEFAERGIAGARVDRVAAIAGCNKALIYTYFGSKEQLFDAVFDALVTSTIEVVPLTANDLPGYAARLYDYMQDHPEVLRLSIWRKLERGDGGENNPVARKANERKIADLKRAQKAGELTSAFTPEECMGLIVAIATMWSIHGSDFHDAKLSDAERKRRKAVVTRAVTQLLGLNEPAKR